MPWNVAPRRERPHMKRHDQWLGYGVHGVLYPLWVKLAFQPYRLALRIYWWRERRKGSFNPAEYDSVP
jgi:hypothetical protein